MKKKAAMDLTYVQGDTFSEFVVNNMSQILKEWNFTGGKSKFFQSAKATPNSLQETFENLFLIIGREKPTIKEDDLTDWAREIGRKRARADFPIYYTLELFHEFRDLFWKTLNCYLVLSEKNVESSDFFKMERYYNQAIDFVIYHFASNYVEQKNEIIRIQQLAAKVPTVPLVSLTEDIGLLTLIGSMDQVRLDNWSEEIIRSLEKCHVTKLIVDINHVQFTDPAVLKGFLHVIRGLQWIGCKAILTGMHFKDGKDLIKTEMLPEGLDVYPTIKQAVSSLGGLSHHSPSQDNRSKTFRKVNRKRQ